MTLTRLVSVPENRSGLLAVERVAACVGSGRLRREINPLYLHGPAGTGKSLLVSTLLDEVGRRSPQLVVRSTSAAELVTLGGETNEDPLADLRQSDLFIIEDLQHLPTRGAEVLVSLFDELYAVRTQMVFTASVGPRHLKLPARLTSRLASGLVVGLEPLQAPSRLVILEDSAQRRQLAVSRDLLAWLANRLTGGGRQLEGALARLEVLLRLRRSPLDIAGVSRYFREQAETARPTVERIVERVGGYFQVEPRQIQSARRTRRLLLPRQVSMFLARQLTDLSLAEIGNYFGGRDHSTVLHACRRLQQTIAQDAALSGAVRQLQAGLT